MKFGFILPYGDARQVAELAREAEQAGWDGLFRPEPVWHIDAWICLTAAAMTTQRIRLGTLISPLPRMRPWRVAAQTATLDNLSGGRVTIGLGVGWLMYGYQAFLDEVTDLKTRTELLDEGIDLLDLLYKGEPFTYQGKHYHVDLEKLDAQYFPPRPVQQPRIPMWVVGVWPRKKSMTRVLKCNGVIPTKMNPDGKMGTFSVTDLCDMKAYLDAERQKAGLTTPFDYIAEGSTTGLDAGLTRDTILPWLEAGATWWMEAPYAFPEEEAVKRLRQGPPQVS